jgi:ferric-dicitrate binding protein FerR (iron transport regulator)
VSIGGGVACLSYYVRQTYTVVSTGPDEVKEVKLPDGTEVWLNKSSTLRYGTFSSQERTVYLEGEGYFKVVHDVYRPFFVRNKNLFVQVFGTTFNLNCCDDSRLAVVSLIGGSIEVENAASGSKVILSPGQRAELDKQSQRLYIREVDAKMDAVWHDGLIPFDKADIFYIAKVLERFYHVAIVFSPQMKADETYSGAIRKKETIDDVLNALQNTMSFDYKITSDDIFISPKHTLD